MVIIWYNLFRFHLRFLPFLLCDFDFILATTVVFIFKKYWKSSCCTWCISDVYL